MRTFVLAIIGIILGIVGGLYVTSENAPAPVRKTLHPELKMEIVGFQPFWLLDQADTDYNRYTSTLTYFGLQIAEDGHIRTRNNEVEEEPGWTNLKSDRVKKLLSDAKTDGVKLSLAVQSANEENILTMMDEPVLSAQNLMEDVEPIIKNYGFDDLNLDIESFVDMPLETQQAFTTYVQTIRTEMKQKNLGTLSIDITPMTLIKQRLIQVRAVEPYVDSIILMGYDYHYNGSYSTGPVAPVNGAGEVREYDVETSLQELIKQAPAQKIILGIPTYGYEWDTLSDIPGSAVIPGTGKTASAKRAEETARTCTDCIKGRDDISLHPYVIIKNGDYYRQIHYVDTESIKTKLQLALKYKIKGLAVWAYGYETPAMRDELSVYR